MLREAYSAVPFRLVSLNGGKSRNAIPRDAVAVGSVPGDRKARSGARSEVGRDIRDAYLKTDAGSLGHRRRRRRLGGPVDGGHSRAGRRVALVPTGPLAMSPDFEGLVETSTSLGEAMTEGGQLTLHSLSRSSNDSALPEVIAALDAAARLGGGTLEVKHNYSGWRPDLDSPVLAVARTVYERLFGQPPVVSAIHAGLETAVIGTKVSGHLDMLAFGPQIEGPHSPDERVSIPTVHGFWKLLAGIRRRVVESGEHRHAGEAVGLDRRLSRVGLVLVVTAAIGTRDDRGDTVPPASGPRAPAAQ